MKKQILCAISVFLLVFCASACSEKNSEKAANAEASTASTTSTEPETKHKYDKSKLKTDENGFLSYEDEQVYSLKGIDVSSYSGDIDWEKVGESGVEFAYIRLGGRGYGDTGALYTDEKAIYNIENARKNGIKVGGYFFSQATSVEEARKEAEYALAISSVVELDFPIAYDFEHIKDDEARTDAVTDAQIARFAEAFGKTMSENNYDRMVYGECEDFTKIYMDSAAQKWIAEYEATPELDESIKIWQYSKEGKVDGIVGSVDLDIMFIDK